MYSLHLKMFIFANKKRFGNVANKIIYYGLLQIRFGNVANVTKKGIKS